jgi:hypothetical protein
MAGRSGRGSEPADSGRVDNGQTNYVLFHLSVWPSSAVPSQRTANGLTTVRRIMYFFHLSVWPSSAVLSQRAADREGKLKTKDYIDSYVNTFWIQRYENLLDANPKRYENLSDHTNMAGSTDTTDA